jgi:tRNA threonylcarbamoyladenosine biosynthesis protein TsaE
MSIGLNEFIYNITKITEIAKIISETGLNIILLHGKLGSGKTTLAREIIRILLNDHKIKVTSPTFNIVNIYSRPGINIAHFDLYRINNSDELYEIGMEEFLNNSICIIEWPQILEECFLTNRKFLKIIIENTINENYRKIQILNNN